MRQGSNKQKGESRAKGVLKRMTKKVEDLTNPKDRLGALKVPLSLVPAVPIIYAALVFELGAYKYGEFNWRNRRVRIRVYIEAIMRHNMALLCGEDIDPESGLPHTAHIIACACIIEDARAAGALIDDRFEKDAGAKLLGLLTSENYTKKMLSQSRTPCRLRTESEPQPTPEEFMERVATGVRQRQAARVAR